MNKIVDVPVNKGFELGCHQWGIKSDVENDKQLLSEKRYGSCDFAKRLVNVSTDYNGIQYHNTFLHEVIEAVNEEYCNGKIKHDNITNIANGLSQVLKSLGIRFIYETSIKEQKNETKH